MKIRLDELLVKRGLCESREKAQRLILGGQVFLEGSPRLVKPATLVEETLPLTILQKPRFVSRGGEKLEKALLEFGIHPQGLSFADIGASTGGFTDCLLQYGAQKVYAVDVGHGQLHETLRNHPRVKVLEKINARYLTLEQLGEKVDGITVDVSFISLALLFAPLRNLLKEEGFLLALIKPQFEAGRAKVRKGVVRSSEVHGEVLFKVVQKAEENLFFLYGLTFSPLLGPKGNIEFWGYWRKQGEPLTEERRRSIIMETIGEAYSHFREQKCS